ncbi:MAG: hypothetical protein VW405_20595 [Rhodospirillaceae bacterium]
MFDVFQDQVTTVWYLWAGLFEPLPYGDPYIAMLLPILGFIFGTRWVINGSIEGA